MGTKHSSARQRTLLGKITIMVSSILELSQLGWFIFYGLASRASKRTHVHQLKKRRLCFLLLLLASMCLPRSFVYRETILYNGRTAGRKMPNSHSQDLLYCAHLNNGLLSHKSEARATTDSLIRCKK